MSDPYGTTPPSDPNDPGLPKAPPPGDPATPPQYGQPPVAPPPYGAPAPQPGAPQYGAPAPQYGAPGPYGAMPSAPRPADPYGATGYSAPLRVGDALRFAWAKFKGNALTWVLIALLMGVVNVAFSARQIRESGEQLNHLLEGGDPLVQTGVTFGATALSFVGMLLSAALMALAFHAALREADGERPTFASYFRGSRTGAAMVTSILVSILVGVASVITFGLGGIVLAIFTVFAVPFVVDRGAAIFGSIGESFRLVGRNFGAVLLLLLALLGINLLGAIPLGLGLLVTIPLSFLAVAYAFRRLTGGTII